MARQENLSALVLTLQRLADNLTSGDYGLTVDVSAPEVLPYLSDGNYGWRILLTASMGLNMPDAVFVYQRLPKAQSPYYDDRFSYVAKVPDLTNVLEGPLPDAELQGWFRLATCDLNFRTVGLAVEVIRAIIADLIGLVQALDGISVLSAIGQIRLGEPVPP